jgi:hypothetical protein
VLQLQEQVLLGWVVRKGQRWCSQRQQQKLMQLLSS